MTTYFYVAGFDIDFLSFEENRLYWYEEDNLSDEEVEELQNEYIDKVKQKLTEMINETCIPFYVEVTDLWQTDGNILVKTKCTYDRLLQTVYDHPEIIEYISEVNNYVFEDFLGGTVAYFLYNEHAMPEQELYNRIDG